MRKGMEDAMNRRELRRQRRRRNQIIAYLVAGLILAAILFGCVFVIRSISGAAQGGNGGVQEEDGGAAGVEEPTGETASEQTETSGQSETPEPTDISAQQENSAEEGSIQQETSGEETLEAQIRGYVEAMTLEEKAAGLFIITPPRFRSSLNGMPICVKHPVITSFVTCPAYVAAMSGTVMLMESDVRTFTSVFIPSAPCMGLSSVQHGFPSLPVPMFSTSGRSFSCPRTRSPDHCPSGV